MARMPLRICAQRLVALHAHGVGVLSEFQRVLVGSSVGRVGIVARAARRLAFPEALGSRKRFADERRRSIASITIKRFPREIRWQLSLVPANRVARL
jgi:hypothetical protein